LTRINVDPSSTANIGGYLGTHTLIMRCLSEVIYKRNHLMLESNASVEDACRKMQSSQVGSVLVIGEGKRLVGIFTGRDVVCRVVAEARDTAETRLRDVMTPDPIVMSPNNTAIEAMRLMWDGGFRHLPIVDDDRILGMLTSGDFNAAEEDLLCDERNLWEHMR